jgi:DNA gyrase subunit A
LGSEEKVSSVLSLAEIAEEKYLVMATHQGTIKKVELNAFQDVRRSGLIAIKLKPEDRLEWVKPSSGKDDIILASANGQSIRFAEKAVRPMGRSAGGVRGMKLKRGDVIAGMDVILEGTSSKNEQLLVIMTHGYGKRTFLKEYRPQGRGGSGIRSAHITEKTGKISSAFIVNAKREQEDIVIISIKGQVIRLPLKQVSVLGRDTQGVRLMRFKETGDGVASVTFV